MVNGWKVTAIIFISLFVVETLLFGWILNIGMEEVGKEDNCIREICKGYDTYYYGDELCQCFEDGEMVRDNLDEVYGTPSKNNKKNPETVRAFTIGEMIKSAKHDFIKKLKKIIGGNNAS